MIRALARLGVVLVGAMPLRAQVAPPAPCPPGTDRLVAEAWAAYRADSIALAARRFDAALSRCPQDHDAGVGRGFAHLRLGEVEAAEARFRAATVAAPAAADGWEGLALVAQRRGDVPVATAAWRRVLALDATRRDAREALDRLAPGWERSGPLVKRRAATLDLTLRVDGDRFVRWHEGRWEPFFVRGVNLGVAMPGKWPTEFPQDSATYARWLSLIGAMHANTVRLYTILPPAFYRALRAHNLAHADAPLHLVHGVWAELPPRDDFGDSAYSAEFAREMRRVVDLLHGAAEFAPRPGHAGGRYDADVSPWTIGYIIGREWEPYTVEAFDADSTAPRRHLGTHLVLEEGTATEAWMARQCDLLLRYEEETYNALRPIAFTNWPTTDPIVHPTETSYAQQMAFRGIEWSQDLATGPIHEEEGVALDPSRVRPTARNAAGWFASYHVYPYYPDFMLLDPGYDSASSSLGRSPYFGYLRDLKRASGGLPLLISEFGVPSSRGNGHQHPLGWDHGGLSEARAAELYVRMAREIREVGAAGAITFAWLDEWFKRNWFVVEFELPAERDRLWHNAMDPEEHFGLMALRPGREDATPLPGGDPARWRALERVAEGPLAGGTPALLRAGQDEGYLYLALESAAWRGRAVDWSRVQLQVAIDTFDPARGQRRLPVSGVRGDVGFEFLLTLAGPGRTRLEVVPDYLPYRPQRESAAGEFYGEPFRGPVRTVTRDDGTFAPMWAMTNRPRFLDDGREVPSKGLDVGQLRYGRDAEDSRADWWHDPAAGMLQVRLPWGLLNVADPSSRRVLFAGDPGQQETGMTGAAPPLGSVPTDGFRFGVVALDGTRVRGTLPARDARGTWSRADFQTWTWSPWEEPTWHEYLKPAYHALRALWGAP